MDVVSGTHVGVPIILAKLLGPYCIIVGLGVLLNLKTYQKVMDDVLKNTAFVYIGGVLALILGLLIVQVHNVWAADWTVLIMIVGWLGVAKGVWLIVFPQTLPKVAEFYRKNTSFWVVRLGIVLMIGIILTMFGYFNG